MTYFVWVHFIKSLQKKAQQNTQVCGCDMTKRGKSSKDITAAAKHCEALLPFPTSRLHPMIMLRASNTNITYTLTFIGEFMSFLYTNEAV